MRGSDSGDAPSSQRGDRGHGRGKRASVTSGTARPPHPKPPSERRYEAAWDPSHTPIRTLFDLASSSNAAEIERAFNEAQVRKLVSLDEMRRALASAPRRAGVLILRDLVEGHEGPNLTRSEAEDRLLALVHAARLPTPAVNVRVGRYEVDFLWRAERLVVEVDGFAFHSSRSAFERDRARDAELQAAGLRVMRITWRQLTDEPEVIVARLAQALALGAA
jgi:very-short-patch-repair endonuclease